MLERVNSIKDLKKIKVEELDELAADLREFMVDAVSRNGGHLASSLGVVELTIAMHYALNTPEDRIIWDVGHQCYAHKLLTGRKEAFSTVRQFKGLSGFPKVSESEFDTYDTGHSSTSLSLALGETTARDLAKKNHKVVAVIGDGSLTGGIAFEALNQIGDLQKDMIIILNDNEQSISNNVGALSRYLTRIISGRFYNRVRKKSYNILKKIPGIGKSIKSFFTRSELNLKSFFVPGMLFEDLGIRYFGPVDGHNTKELIALFQRIKNINNGPKLIHVITKKGKGYSESEANPSRFHGIGPFDIKSGETAKRSGISFSAVAGGALNRLAKNDKKVIAITAAMVSGTGLGDFSKNYPDRFFDVGIAEQHMLTFGSALAKNGMKPYIAVYSTFLQRAYDQLIHDIALMKLPVKILIDRAGIVGADGETHHGLFDISFIKNIPNFLFFSPVTGEELRDIIHFANNYDKGPVAIRYPRGTICDSDYNEEKVNDFTPGKIKVLSRGSDLAILAVGDMVHTANGVKLLLADRGVSVTVVNLLSICPLDLEGIESVLSDNSYFITLENGYMKGGIGEDILTRVKPHLRNKILFTGGFPQEFIHHGTNKELFQEYSLTPEGLSEKILKQINNGKEN